jgi:hypothetical protein
MGAMMGYILDQLLTLQPKLSVNTVTLVGFSLGAHTIAFAANWLQTNRSTTLPVLIGWVNTIAGHAYDCVLQVSTQPVRSSATRPPTIDSTLPTLVSYRLYTRMGMSLARWN